MAVKEFKILLALSDMRFVNQTVKLLRTYYTVSYCKSLQDFSDQIHKGDFDLIVIDYRFGGMRAEDVYQGIEFLHPNAVFVVYTDKDKKKIAKKLWKRRAIDYINHTREPNRFVQSVNKAVRCAIQKRDTVSLEKTLKKIESLVQEVKTIVKRWK